VSINQLKRFVADWEMNSGRRLPISCAPDTGKRVAIIGGGPAGVSCAYFLRRLGHHPTIYEAMSKLGGITRYGIPEYRLPDEVLDWEIEGILNLGIDVHYNTSMGEDFTIQIASGRGLRSHFHGHRCLEGLQTRHQGRRPGRRLPGHQFPLRSGQPPDKKVPIGKRRRLWAAATRPSTACAPCCAWVRRGLHRLSPDPQGDAGQRSGNRGLRA
jgi:formate dehydrogenase beta subunit